MNWNSFGAASKPNESLSAGLIIKLNRVIISATKNMDKAKPAIAIYFSNAIIRNFFLM
jgi:hypothetical protein